MIEVVILPGLDGTGKLLRDFCFHLATLGIPARVVTYPAEHDLGYAELEALVRAQLPDSAGFVLVGESFSGPVAIRIAADPPPGLKGLVLSTTFARSPVFGLSRLSALVRFAPTRPPMALLSWILLGRWATSDLQATLAEALRLVRPSVIRTRAVAALRVDVSEWVSAVRVPVLQFVALQDRLLAPSAPRALADSLANCNTITLPGPHLLLQTSGERCAQEVAAFAQRLVV
ncbi:MAG: alpha/beta hydrolase [Ahniella sp.]|nr:alpha/beta hydrolase [Ahniella sp.]